MTVTPVEVFSITAVPAEEEVDVTVSWMTFPALIGIPVKSVDGLGNHSNHASKETAPLLATLKSTPVWRIAF